MNFLQKVTNRFTIRGRALIHIDLGMSSARKGENENAIEYYTIVIGSLDSPKDVQAVALFNRSLAYTKVGEEMNATKDLYAVLNMPGAQRTIKKSAKDKLVRMQRKQTREENP